MSIGERVQRLERDPPAEALGLALVLRERHARQDVAGRALQEDALAAGHAPDEAPQRTREVGRVDVHVVAGRHGMAAEADQRRDAALVRAAQLQRSDLSIELQLGVPAEDGSDRRRRALAAVDGLVHLADGPDRLGGLEPLEREAADLDHAILDRDRRPAHLLAVGVVTCDQRHALVAGRREMRVVPAQQHRRGIAAARLRDAVDQPVRRGCLQPDAVDPAEHDARVPLLEHDGAGLERPDARARARGGSAGRSRASAVRRRIEREGGCAGSHQYIRKPPLTLIVAPEM